MNEFKKLRKASRRAAITAGIIIEVAEATGKNKSTVSRTFSGKFLKPNPEIVKALHDFMIRHGIPREFTS